MKQYYSERTGLLAEAPTLKLKELREYFFGIYVYFLHQGCFESAFSGIWREHGHDDRTQVLPPTLAPSPEIFFFTKLNNNHVWPIPDCYEKYSEETLFSVIEILYDHIALFDFETLELENEAPRTEFVEHINNVLRFYGEGYYLEPTNGFIMLIPNESLRNQLSYDGADIPDTVLTQLTTATKMYYRFESNMEEKKKAINILADILELERKRLQDILNQEYQINKNKHDRLIFDTVNNCNIRHNKEKQLKDYNREIWYDWMMQYYTSVIIAFYKLSVAISEPQAESPSK